RPVVPGRANFRDQTGVVGSPEELVIYDEQFRARALSDVSQLHRRWMRVRVISLPLGFAQLEAFRRIDLVKEEVAPVAGRDDRVGGARITREHDAAVGRLETVAERMLPASVRDSERA